MPFDSGDMVLRLIIATVCGAIIGIERSFRNHPAGVRTFSLVCLGSAIAMVTDEYLVVKLGTGDPARLAAQVVSGVGFLGVGTIIITGNHSVKGLSTAAVLWATACLGIAIGAGNMILGLSGFVLILLVMTVLSSISHLVDNNTSTLTLLVEGDNKTCLASVQNYAAAAGIQIVSMERQNRTTIEYGDIAISIKINLRRCRNHAVVVDEVYHCEGVHYIEELR